MTFNARIGELAHLLQASERTFALTGAGISTESGIPDFRTRGSGLWEKADPAEVCSIDAFHRNPAAFWRNNMQWWQTFNAAEPNVGHHALAALQKAGLLFGVITQNIDGLHMRAGSTIWEVHGHLRTVHCLRCERRESFEIIEKWLTGVEGEEAPRCNCGGLLRPDVVLFGDQMSPDFWVATQVLSGCQLLLVVGSSLQVYPVAGLPQLARDLVIINRDPTPYDNQAQLVIRESIGTVFKELLKQLGL